MEQMSEFEKNALEHIKNCIIKYYDGQSIKYDATKSAEGVIVDFFSWLYRQIAPIKRKVSLSHELQKKIEEKSLSAEDIDILDFFRKRFENGDDMRGFQSVFTLDSEKTDYLRYTWNIYHLHMTKTVANNEEEMRKNRAGRQLLVVIQDMEVLFVDVSPHPARGQAHEYFNLNHLRILRDNGWFERIGFSEMDDIIPRSLEPKITSSSDIYKLYKSNMNMAFELDGKAYQSMSFITMSSHPLRAVDTLHQILKNIHALDVVGNECEFVAFDTDTNNHLMILITIKEQSGNKRYFDLLQFRELTPDGSRIEEVAQ